MMKRVVSMMLGAVLFCTSCSYAEEIKKENMKVLTYEYALELAIQNSLDVKTTERKIKKVETQEKTLSDQAMGLVSSIEQNPNFDAMIEPVSFGLEKAYLDKEVYEQSIRYTKTMLESAIRTLFNGIDTSYQNIRMYEKEIDLKKEEIKIADIKFAGGLISKYDYAVLKTSLEAMEKELKKQHLELKKQVLELNQYLNLKDIDSYSIKTIVYEFKPIQMTNEQVKTRAFQASSANMQVTAKEHGISIQQLLLNRNLYEGNASVQQADIYIEQTELLKLKEDIRAGVFREYQNLELLRERIGLLEHQQRVKLEELENEKIKLVAGKVSSFSLEQKKVEIDKMDVQIKEMKKMYETSKIHFNNLHLAGSSM